MTEPVRAVREVRGQMSVVVPESIDQALATILEGLIASQRGEPYDEEQLSVCAEYCVVSQFMALGVGFDAITHNLYEREHTFRFTYSETDGLAVEVEWLDGDTEIDVDLDLAGGRDNQTGESDGD